MSGRSLTSLGLKGGILVNYRSLMCLACLCVLLVPAGLYGAAFDPLPAGARANGMGGAYTAVASDPSAVYWNPAGLSGLRQSSFLYTHMDVQTLGLLSYDYFSYAQPFVFNNAVALSWTRLGTTANVNFMNYSENTFTLAYEQPITSALSVGLNFKAFQVLYDSTASGIGFDFGARYQILKNLAAGAMLENFNNPQIVWITQATDDLPKNLRVGFAANPTSNFTLALDADRLLESKPQAHLGAENWFFSKMLALRAGVTYWSAENHYTPSAGFGFRFSALEFSYAYSSHFDFDGNHVLSLQWGF